MYPSGCGNQPNAKDQSCIIQSRFNHVGNVVRCSHSTILFAACIGLRNLSMIQNQPKPAKMKPIANRLTIERSAIRIGFLNSEGERSPPNVP